MHDELRAPDSIRLTFLEEVCDVLCSVAAVNVTRMHPLSRALYNVVITGLITDLHSGYSLPFMPENWCPGWVGSRRHYQHHMGVGTGTRTKYYQKFFMYLDYGLEMMESESEGKLEGAKVD